LLPDTADSRTFLAYVSPGLAMIGLGCLTYYALSAKKSGDTAQR